MGFLRIIKDLQCNGSGIPGDFRQNTVQPVQTIPRQAFFFSDEGISNQKTVYPATEKGKHGIIYGAYDGLGIDIERRVQNNRNPAELFVFLNDFIKHGVLLFAHCLQSGRSIHMGDPFHAFYLAWKDPVDDGHERLRPETVEIMAHLFLHDCGGKGAPGFPVFNPLIGPVPRRHGGRSHNGPISKRPRTYFLFPLKKGQDLARVKESRDLLR